MLTSAIEKVVNLISPYECLVCSVEGQVVCEGCWEQNVPNRKPACFWCNTLTKDGRTCPRCKKKTYLDGATISFRLNGLVEQCIYELKYYHNRSIAEFLASNLTEIHARTQFDYIGFVPATGKNQRRRGYNQAMLLARAVSHTCNIPLIKCLARIAHTDQIGLNRTQRLDSVTNNFIASGKFTDKNIILIDDVLTTGATLNECARILKQAGAKKVWAIVVAKK